MAAKTLLACVALAATISIAAATYGADVSVNVMPSTFKCLKSNGIDFVIIRAYQSLNRPDPEAPHCIYNAWDGGMEHVDIYMFPAPRAGNPAGQFRSMVNSLKGFNISHSSNPAPHSFGTIWLDIEGPQYWTSSHSANIAFIQGLINEAHSMGLPLGVYTSESQWSPITGGWTGASHLPLWYPHYGMLLPMPAYCLPTYSYANPSTCPLVTHQLETLLSLSWVLQTVRAPELGLRNPSHSHCTLVTANPSFSDFRSFGGWAHPAIKQYNDNGNLCGASYDKNFY